VIDASVDKIKVPVEVALQERSKNRGRERGRLEE
jgi:hypothetical protein